MLDLATHWPQHATSTYWPQAIDYAVWVFNRLPNMESGMAPNEIWSGVRSPCTKLFCSHVFGCPVYVLNTSLQDGKKIPKWSPCARLGLFMGFSDLHSSQVPLVLNVATGHISPQFHVIFDDKFERVNLLPLDQPLNRQWAQMFQMGCECFMDMDYDENDHPILTSLSDIIKQYTEAEPAKSVEFVPINVTDFLPAIPTAIPQAIPPQPTTTPLQPAIPPQNIMTNNFPQIIVPGGDDIMEPSNNDNAVSGGETATNDTASGCPRRSVGMYKDGPSIIWRLPINGESYDLAFSVL
jgi:hypothetical protein